MIKSALSVLPTRPVVFIVPIVVAVVMSIYYWNLYTDCTHDRKFRESLNVYLSKNTAKQFRLSDVTEFNWDKVRIIGNYKPEIKVAGCPFGWNWSAAERESLIASNLLSILIFAYEGIIVEHIELRNDQVTFEKINTSLLPETAIFNVAGNRSNTVTLKLTH